MRHDKRSRTRTEYWSWVASSCWRFSLNIAWLDVQYPQRWWDKANVKRCDAIAHLEAMLLQCASLLLSEHSDWIWRHHRYHIGSNFLSTIKKKCVKSQKQMKDCWNCPIWPILQDISTMKTLLMLSVKITAARWEINTRQRQTLVRTLAEASIDLSTRTWCIRTREEVLRSCATVNAYFPLRERGRSASSTAHWSTSRQSRCWVWRNVETMSSNVSKKQDWIAT